MDDEWYNFGFDSDGDITPADDPNAPKKHAQLDQAGRLEKHISNFYNFGSIRLEYTFRNPGNYSRVTVYEDGNLIFDGTAEEYLEKHGKNLDKRLENFSKSVDEAMKRFDADLKEFNRQMDKMFPENIPVRNYNYQVRIPIRKRNYNSGLLGTLLLSLLILAIFAAGVYFLGTQIIDFIKGLF